MSHLVTISTKLRDLDAIREACKRLNWTFCEGQKSYQWYGRWVDDSPVPLGLFESAEEHARVVAMSKADRIAYMQGILGKCTHAIKVPGSEYEIGLIERGGEYIPIWDWATDIGRHCTSTPDNYSNQDFGPFLKNYAVAFTMREAQANGYGVAEEQCEDGGIRLLLNKQEW